MISFKDFLLIEIAEPIKPLKKISKTIIKKDAGTWKERPVIQYKFKTTNGNEIKIHFEKKETNIYDVMFYVNDTQNDDASSTEKDTRDKEILANVVWMIKQKANQLKINQLTFIAQIGKNDRKNVKNLNIEKYKKPFLENLNKLKFELNKYQTKLIEPNHSIYIKLNKPIPPARPDVDKDLFNKIFQEIEQLIHNNQSLETLLNNTYHIFENLKISGININEFLKSFEDLSNAIQSNLPSGWNKYSNRREVVWEKIVNRYFSDWNVLKDGTKFELTRL